MGWNGRYNISPLIHGFGIVLSQERICFLRADKFRPVSIPSQAEEAYCRTIFFFLHVDIYMLREYFGFCG